MNRMKRYMSVPFALIVFAPAIHAQVMATMGPISPESLGLPPQPPFITLLGIANPGKMATDPSIPPKGAVRDVFYEELRAVTTPAGPAGSVQVRVRTRYDEKGNVIEINGNRYGSTTDDVYRYQDGRLVGIESTFPDSPKPQPTAWNYWTYDSHGKLTEYRRGRGTETQNHELGYRYDNKGRLLGFEYRQGKDDKLFSHTDISYSSDDRTVVVTRAFAGSKIIDRSTRTLDDKGRVVRVALDSEGRAADNLASIVVFRYDDLDRLLEQTTNATQFSKSGAEEDLPPGTISIAYDDAAHTTTTKYSFPGEGNMESAVTRDQAGATTSFTLKTGSERITSKLDCEYDSQGNWTTCRQITNTGMQQPAKTFRQTITYR